jgi:molybdopterin molybdotransferase
MLSVQQALEKILADPALKNFHKGSTESLSLLQSMGRVLAENQIATIDVPLWDNSAMDGYALRASDSKINFPIPISQIIPAGKFPTTLQKNTVARIFTGAPVPAGADSVEMQENIRIDDEGVHFLQAVKPGANIRRRGEDIAKGTVVVAAGTELQPQHLGLLASVGIASVPVHKLLRVAALSTGDELAEPGALLKDGQIYNSNRYLLMSLLQQLGCEVIDGGMVGDDLAATQQRLGELAQRSDVIISSGGVSVGDEDHVKKAVENIGALDLWKISVKPGKPLAFGHIGKTTFFGLPGNPVSAFVTFFLFVKPYLLKAQGATNIHPLLIEAVADFDWPAIPTNKEKAGKERKPLGREEYLRARLKEDGRSVEIYPNQGSGALSSVVWANGLAIAPQGSVINRGDKIKFLFVE